MSEVELLDRLADAVAKRVQPALPVAIDLWDVEAIGAFLKRAPKVVRERIVTLPDFPKAIRLPSVQSGKTDEKPVRSLPLWEAAEVIAWARSYKGWTGGRPRKKI